MKVLNMKDVFYLFLYYHKGLSIYNSCVLIYFFKEWSLKYYSTKKFKFFSFEIIHMCVCVLCVCVCVLEWWHMSTIDKMKNNEIKNNGYKNISYYLHYIISIIIICNDNK